MARSRRKTPVCGFTTCRSEKIDKKINHSRERARARSRLLKLDDYIEVDKREISDPYSMGKDGKQRFDPDKYPEIMRK